MNMKAKSALLLMAAFCLFLGSCQHHPKTLAERIDNLQQQVNRDSKTLYELEENEFPQLKKDFQHCDSLLQHLDSVQLNATFEQLNLVQAYISQFADLKADMRKKLDYSLVQLDRLKADTESHYLTDSLAEAYFETESQVADTLHHRVLYFKEKLDSCRKSLSNLKK